MKRNYMYINVVTLSLWRENLHFDTIVMYITLTSHFSALAKKVCEARWTKTFDLVVVMTYYKKIGSVILKQ